MKKVLIGLALTQIVGCSSLLGTQHFEEYTDNFSENTTTSVSFDPEKQFILNNDPVGAFTSVKLTCHNIDGIKDLSFIVGTRDVFGDGATAEPVQAKFYFSSDPRGWSFSRTTEKVKVSRTYQADGDTIGYNGFILYPEDDFYDALIFASEGKMERGKVYLTMRALREDNIAWGDRLVTSGATKGKVRKLIEDCRK